MSLFFSGFADELTKVAGPLGLLERLRRSPELRRAIGHSALLGAITGAGSGLLTKKDEHESRLHKILAGAAVGGVTGGVTGAAFPRWFAGEQRYARDELP